MKYFFRVSLPLCFAYFLITSAQTQSSVIGTSIVMGKIEIAQNDFPTVLNWKAAKKACTKLGKGWRLPTMGELKNMHSNREKIGGFKTSYYWSSTRANPNFSKSGYIEVDFKSGSEWWAEADQAFNVRAVRTLE